LHQLFGEKKDVQERAGYREESLLEADLSFELEAIHLTAVTFG